ncbi:hypothetical protein [Dyella terrae]|uniref:hypothetical protein n=1 Tax=Dyella terrae TaxID=522259 RepID=UPI001EFD569F|nr:hypothetical protein [Dyella terrae]ULU26416.1 hypothetical protein DYST_03362 [Dyella terrae]
MPRTAISAFAGMAVRKVELPRKRKKLSTKSSVMRSAVNVRYIRFFVRAPLTRCAASLNTLAPGALFLVS